MLSNNFLNWLKTNTTLVKRNIICNSEDVKNFIHFNDLDYTDLLILYHIDTCYIGNGDIWIEGRLRCIKGNYHYFHILLSNCNKIDNLEDFFINSKPFHSKLLKCYYILRKGYPHSTSKYFIKYDVFSNKIKYDRLIHVSD